MSTWDKINAQFLWIFENTKNVAGWVSISFILYFLCFLLCMYYSSFFLSFHQVFAHSRQIGWFIVTTGMITAFPLIFEVSISLKEGIEGYDVMV